MSVTNTGIPNTTTTRQQTAPLFLSLSWKESRKGVVGRQRIIEEEEAFESQGLLLYHIVLFFFLLCCDAFFGERTDGRALGVGL